MTYLHAVCLKTVGKTCQPIFAIRVSLTNLAITQQILGSQRMPNDY